MITCRRVTSQPRLTSFSTEKDALTKDRSIRPSTMWGILLFLRQAPRHLLWSRRTASVQSGRSTPHLVVKMLPMLRSSLASRPPAAVAVPPDLLPANPSLPLPAAFACFTDASRREPRDASPAAHSMLNFWPSRIRETPVGVGECELGDFRIKAAQRFAVRSRLVNKETLAY